MTICLAYFLLSSFISIVVSFSIPSYQVDCVSPPILAPIDDCKAVIKHLKAIHISSGRDRLYEWGRTVDNSDPTKIQLPIGFRLEPLYPGRQARLRCEIHVDNEVDRASATDRFTFADLVYAAANIIERCYPIQTGKVYPQILTKNVYATTTYLAPLGDATQNYTIFTMDQNSTTGQLTELGQDVVAA